MAAYPPYQHPLLERGGRVTRPWQLFFLSLVGGDVAGAILPGTITLDLLESIDAPRLLGRGSAGTGPVEVLTIGDGLAMAGTELSATPVEEAGYWSVITNGDPLSPELLFDSNGDAIMGWVPTP